MNPEEVLALYHAAKAEREAERKDADNVWEILRIILGSERMYELEDVIVLNFAKQWYNECAVEMTNPREPLEETVANMQAALRAIKWHMPHNDYVTYTKELMEEDDD
jgi:hypothetical protein